MGVTISLKEKDTLVLLSKASSVSLCWILESYDGKRKAGFKLSDRDTLDNSTMEAVIEADDNEAETVKFSVSTLVNNKRISSKEVLLKKNLWL